MSAVLICRNLRQNDAMFKAMQSKSLFQITNQNKTIIADKGHELVLGFHKASVFRTRKSLTLEHPKSQKNLHMIYLPRN